MRRHGPVFNSQQRPLYLEKTMKKAFTLIELLVVLAIIGILVAVIIPAVAKARSSAYAAVCTNNLRQFGIIFHLYIDDHEGKFPPVFTLTDRWYDHIKPYVDDEGIWYCPCHKATTVPYGPNMPYSYNYFVGGCISMTHGIDINQIKDTTKRVVVADSGKTTPDWASYSYMMNRRGTGGCCKPGDCHFGGANVLFADGHVELVKQTVLTDASNEIPFWRDSIP